MVKQVLKRSERISKSTKNSPVKSDISKKSYFVKLSPKDKKRLAPKKLDFGFTDIEDDEPQSMLDSKKKTQKRIKVAQNFNFAKFVTPTLNKKVQNAEVSEFKIPDLPKNWKKKS